MLVNSQTPSTLGAVNSQRCKFTVTDRTTVNSQRSAYLYSVRIFRKLHQLSVNFLTVNSRSTFRQLFDLRSPSTFRMFQKFRKFRRFRIFWIFRQFRIFRKLIIFRIFKRFWQFQSFQNILKISTINFSGIVRKFKRFWQFKNFQKIQKILKIFEKSVFEIFRIFRQFWKSRSYWIVIHFYTIIIIYKKWIIITLGKIIWIFIIVRI